MAYRHYETEGLIISHRNLGEANRLYQILTPDFGLINVLAQGVRREPSKLRYHLENFSFTRLTLVRGREFWRVVGVSDLGLQIRFSKEALPFFKKVFLVLQRLVHGEEFNPLIYNDFKRAANLIFERSPFLTEDLSNLEVFTLIRLLIQLGYLSLPIEPADIFLTPDFSWVEVEKIKMVRPALIKRINQALMATQL